MDEKHKKYIEIYILYIFKAQYLRFLRCKNLKAKRKFKKNIIN